MGFWDKFKEEFKEQVDIEREKMLQKQEEKKLENQEYKNRIQELKKDSKYRKKELKIKGIAHCPKCKSTSIQYIERRKMLSLGRGVVGNALAGPVGAAVGAVTSKKHKGFVKCLSCGKEWKK